MRPPLRPRHLARPAATALAALLALACGSGDLRPADPPAKGELRASLLAVGDTGRREGWLPSRLDRVAAGLAAVAEQRPVDAVVVLGDNFYPRGLESDELVERVRTNVVGPLCRFVDLSAPRSPEVADACELPEARRHRVPIFAVLGNHDYRDDASPALQTREVPRFVANWAMPAGPVEVHAVGAGVSLVLLQSMPMVEHPEGLAALARALREAPGPWRIVAAHHPVVATKAEPNEFEARYLVAARRAIAESGVPVQLVLGGHHHSLQILRVEGSRMPTQVVSGAGSRSVDDVLAQPALDFASDHNGFVRVDLVEDEEERLVVSFYATRPPWLPPAAPQLEARWSIDRDGVARELETSPVP